ncbi:hypothetical protein VTN49DRAFT_1663 [Thermomyces lanuginosus]|uniref:uncharacterized protein n=1 Tax=Thermomyces lanuginosus TaxID=5541 RepID=UPI00374448FA
MPESNNYALTQEQKDHFMKYGYIRLTNCFSKEKAAEWTKDLWTRLGMSPTDKETWTSERIHMPHHKQEPVRTFAPKAWAAICELLGGEDRIVDEHSVWYDSFIVNLGTKEWEGRWPHPRDLTNWHVDGDFFIHFLDSPEQGLLVIPLFSDIDEHGGGTMICPDAIPHIAKHLHDHPEGVTPQMTPRGQQPQYEGLGFFCEIAKKCDNFIEMTGKVGDVILLHPLMLHSASKNSLRQVRVITNPRVALKEPFNFDRDDPNEYSLVERKTLQALGVDRLPGWKIVGERETVVPERIRIQAEMKKKEEERLRAVAAASA